MATTKRVAKIAAKELESKATPKKYRSPIASDLANAKGLHGAIAKATRATKAGKKK